MCFAVILCLSSLSSSVAGALVVSHEKKKNTTGKGFEYRSTPNALEYEIFLMNLRIGLKYTDCCNLKLTLTLYVYVLLSQ